MEKLIFYHIYPLGFCDAPEYNDYNIEPVERLNKIKIWLNHIKSLGVGAIYFGPLFESYSHGYDTTDYFNIDRRLGNNESFIELVNLLHENEIKIVVDGVFNHVGRDFFAFKDLLINKQKSKYCNWFKWVNFNQSNSYNDPFSYEGWEGHINLVKLNTDNEEVKNYIYNVIKFWRETFKIDGIRLDAANSMDINFLNSLANFCKSLKSGDDELFLIGEVIHGDYNRWANKDCLDSVTNYECYKGLYSSHNEKNYFEIAYSLNRQFGDYAIYKNIPLYNFVDNHDVNRIASTLKNKKDLFNIYTILYTMPGVPSIYYGSEFGLEGVKENNSDKNLRPSLELDELLTKDEGKELLDYIKKLGKIIRESKALKYGYYKEILVKNKQFAFTRVYQDEVIVVALSIEESPEVMEINIPLSISTKENKKLKSLVTGQEYIIENNKINVGEVTRIFEIFVLV
ncbi:MAG: alpha-amylase family glycosyl hydrolase [Clostridiaceae bacterium]